jgi:hypothetical protein
MQAAKDSFYITLRDRLAAHDPGLIITVDGASRPAIVVMENEPASALPPQNKVFYLSWGEAEPAHAANSALMAMQCTIRYTTQGDSETGGVGRGRELGELDADLLAICMPPQTHKLDYSSGTATELGSEMFWTTPNLTVAKTEANKLGREARLTVFFYPEVMQS